MDNDNLSTPQEPEATPDSTEKQSSVGNYSTDSNGAKHSSIDVDGEMNEPETTQDASKATGIGRIETAHSQAVSNDKNIKPDAKLNETPVFKHAENSDIVDISADINGLKQPTDGENSNKTENLEQDNSKSAEILNSKKDNINTKIIDNSNDESSNIDDTINNQYDQSKSADSNNSPYYIKWITWKGLKTAIVTQNDNGPCPLLAIINVLLLRRVIAFPNMQEMVTTQQLMEYLGDVVLKEYPENMGEGVQRNFEQNMQDALSILPKLKTGLDVNVKFTGVDKFEFTPECVIFHLLNIKLYHGWLVDPQSVEYKNAIGSLSYNQLVEKIISNKETKGDSELTSEGLLAESFLQETANQLTYHGVFELNAKLNEDELCIFFRNNHFSTLYKHQGELFLLLTDQGFLTEDEIVWQTLSSVDGDGIFVDYNFKSNVPAARPPASGSGALTQEDQDYMLALSIQNEQQQEAQQPSSPPTPQPTQQPAQQAPTSQPLTQEPQESRSNNDNAMTEQELFDLQYAMQLQEEEEARARTGQQQQQPQQRQRRQPAPERRAGRRQTPPPAAPVQGNIQQRQSGPSCVIL